jgi:hypothetical protein
MIMEVEYEGMVMPIWSMLSDVDGFSDEMICVEMCFPEFLYFSRKKASLLGNSMSKEEDGGGKTCFLNY